MFKKHAFTRKGAVIAVAAAMTLTGAGVAFAYWSSLGAGDGTAVTGTNTEFVVTTDEAVGVLKPGGVAVVVPVSILNPADVAQTVSEVTVTLADDTGAAWVPAAGCLAADYTAVENVTPGVVLAGATLEGTISITMADTTADQDACKGESVPLHVVVS